MFDWSNGCIVAVLPLVTFLALVAGLKVAHNQEPLAGTKCLWGSLDRTKCPFTEPLRCRFHVSKMRGTRNILNFHWVIHLLHFEYPLCTYYALGLFLGSGLFWRAEEIVDAPALGTWGQRSHVTITRARSFENVSLLSWYYSQLPTSGLGMGFLGAEVSKSFS